MKLDADIIIAGETYPVIEIRPGNFEDLLLTLDRAPNCDTRKRESILMLREGRNKEPVRLCNPPEGARLTVRRIY